MRELTLSVWVLVVAACLVAGRSAVTVHAQDDVSATWNEQAAAGYLDERQNWWMNWPRTARENGTFCVSCHTAAPYALARSALHGRSIAGCLRSPS